MAGERDGIDIVQAAAHARIACTPPAEPDEALVTNCAFEADDFSPVGDAARCIASCLECEARSIVYRAAKLEFNTLIPSIRAQALEDAAKVADRNAKWHAESFRKELILKNEDRQTHFAARYLEAEEIASSIRNLKGDGA